MRIKAAVVLAVCLALSPVVAQNTAPARAPAPEQPTQVSQSAPAWVIPAAIAAGIIAVVLIASDDSHNPPSH